MYFTLRSIFSKFVAWFPSKCIPNARTFIEKYSESSFNRLRSLYIYDRSKSTNEALRKFGINFAVKFIRFTLSCL